MRRTRPCAEGTAGGTTCRFVGYVPKAQTTRLTPACRQWHPEMPGTRRVAKRPGLAALRDAPGARRVLGRELISSLALQARLPGGGPRPSLAGVAGPRLPGPDVSRWARPAPITRGESFSAASGSQGSRNISV